MVNEKCYLKKDDKVKVIAGKDKGKIGKIVSVNRKKNLVLVENINVAKRHTRASAQNRQGGIVESEAPIQRSNVMAMCSKCVKPSRLRMQRLEDGKKIRVCANCGESLDT